MSKERNVVALCLQVKCVVVGFDEHFNYRTLAKACCYLNVDGCKFIATNTDAGLPMGPGKFLPGLVYVL